MRQEQILRPCFNYTLRDTNIEKYCLVSSLVREGSISSRFLQPHEKPQYTRTISAIRIVPDMLQVLTDVAAVTATTIDGGYQLRGGFIRISDMQFQEKNLVFCLLFPPVGAESEGWRYVIPASS
jgi:hypothetical protein